MITPTQVLTHGALAASLLVGMAAVFSPEAAMAQARTPQASTELVRRSPVRPQTPRTAPEGTADIHAEGSVARPQPKSSPASDFPRPKSKDSASPNFRQPSTQTDQSGAPGSHDGDLPTAAAHRTDQKLDKILSILSALGEHAATHRGHKRGAPDLATTVPGAGQQPSPDSEPAANPVAPRRTPTSRIGPDVLPHPPGTPFTPRRATRP